MYFLKCCEASLANWAGISAGSLEQLKLVIQDDEGLKECEQWYTGEVKEGTHYGMDTADRDVLFDVIAQHFTGQSWPLNMERDRHDAFHAKLTEQLEEAGWSYG